MNDYSKAFGSWGNFQAPGPLPGLGGTLTPQQISEFNIGTDPSADAGFFDSFSNWLGSDQGRNLLGGVDPISGKATKGLIPTGFGIASNLANSWMAMQQLDLAQDQFDFSKDAFNKQYENQKSLTNTHLRDRQAARRSFSDRAAPVDEYMAQNGLK
ncbi:MAG: hypothetical protein ACRBB6_04190 [Neptuniibacter sp.]